MKLSVLLLMVSFLASAKVLTIATYNAYNLFDTKHDIGKNDYTYLPLSFKQQSQEVQDYCASISNDYYRENCFTFDWNEKVLDKKLKNLKEAILAFDNGNGADVIALQEVENINALNMLRDRLIKHGYKYSSLIEGPDSRGIDVGYLSKYPIIKEKLHLIDMEGIAKKTRGILEIDIMVKGLRVTLLNNHWPSQNNPDEARLLAAKRLVEVAQNIETDLLVALGDFNTLDSDTPHGINLVIKPEFDLARDEAILLGQKVFAGSHWYAGHWSALDKIMVLKNRSFKVRPLYEEYKILNYKFLLGETIWTDRDTGEQTPYSDVPIGYDVSTGKGYSDHLPVIMKFRIGK